MYKMSLEILESQFEEVPIGPHMGKYESLQG
jgi:hypothetical protein